VKVKNLHINAMISTSLREMHNCTVEK